jgi:hypothetical protein
MEPKGGKLGAVLTMSGHALDSVVGDDGEVESAFIADRRE